MRKKAVIFGTGPLAELANFYLENDSAYEVKAFCITDPVASSFCEKPLVKFEDVERLFPPEEYEMFVAVGYRQMNHLRKIFCQEARLKGYTLLSYISSTTTYWGKNNKIGDNVFIFEDNTIQPFVEIGDGTILWSGNHIGHHSRIASYSFLSSHVVVAGFCNIGTQSFLGVNSTLIDNISLGSKVLVGAGALVSQSLSDGQVIVSPKSVCLEKRSDYFLR